MENETSISVTKDLNSKTELTHNDRIKAIEDKKPENESMAALSANVHMKEAQEIKPAEDTKEERKVEMSRNESQEAGEPDKQLILQSVRKLIEAINERRMSGENRLKSSGLVEAGLRTALINHFRSQNTLSKNIDPYVACFEALRLKDRKSLDGLMDKCWEDNEIQELQEQLGTAENEWDNSLKKIDALIAMQDQQPPEKTHEDRSTKEGGRKWRQVIGVQLPVLADELGEFMTSFHFPISVWNMSRTSERCYLAAASVAKTLHLIDDKEKDLYQLGGEVLLCNRGKQFFLHKCQVTEDRPPWNELLAMIDNGARKGPQPDKGSVTWEKGKLIKKSKVCVLL